MSEDNPLLATKHHQYHTTTINKPSVEECLPSVDLHAASLWNSLTYRWILPILHASIQRNDVHPFPVKLHTTERAASMAKRLASFFSFERQPSSSQRKEDSVHEKKKRLFRAVVSLIGWEVFIASFPYLLAMLCAVSQPRLLEALIDHLKEPGEGFFFSSEEQSRQWHELSKHYHSSSSLLNVYHYLHLHVMYLFYGVFTPSFRMGLLLVFGFVLASVGRFLFHHWHFHITLSAGARLKSGLTALLFRKTISLPPSALSGGCSSSGDQSDHSSVDRATQLNSLLTDAVQSVGEAVGWLHYVWSVPLMICICATSLNHLVGLPATCLAIGLVAGTIPLQAFLTKKLQIVGDEALEEKNARMNLISELFQGIGMIKSLVWEHKFIGKIEQHRKEELAALRKAQLWKVATIVVQTVTPAVACMSIFFLLTYYEHKTLSPGVVFPAIAFLQLLSNPLKVIPKSLSIYFEANVSLKDIAEHLDFCDFQTLEREKVKKGTAFDDREFAECQRMAAAIDQSESRTIQKHDNESRHGHNKQQTTSTTDSEGNPYFHYFASVDSGGGNLPSGPPEVRLQNAVFRTWCQPNHGCSPVSFTAPAGKLTVILGGNGSHKSMIAAACVGQVPLISGTVDGIDCIPKISKELVGEKAIFVRTGGRAYCPQVPVMFQGSIKSNIMFFEIEEEQQDEEILTDASEANTKCSLLREAELRIEREKGARLEEALKSCWLHDDLNDLPYGVNTNVGERGSSLSGGQRSRVALARAVYYKPELAVLDAPLAAVDASVGHNIIHDCLLGALGGATRIVCTHNVALAANADHVVVLKEASLQKADPSGNMVEFEGTFSEYLEFKYNICLHPKVLREYRERIQPATVLREEKRAKKEERKQRRRDKPHSSSSETGVSPTPTNSEASFNTECSDEWRCLQQVEMSFVAPPADWNAPSLDASSTLSTELADPSPQQPTEEDARLAFNASFVDLDLNSSFVGGGAFALPSTSSEVDAQSTRASTIPHRYEDAESIDSSTSDEDADEKKDGWVVAEKLAGVAAAAGPSAKPGAHHRDDSAVEGKAAGKIPWSVYSWYIDQLGGARVAIIVFAVFLFTQCLSMGHVMWLSLWSANEFHSLTSAGYAHVYFWLILLFAICASVRSIVLFRAAAAASQLIHTHLLESVANASMRFFDRTSLGRVLNRFRSDIGVVDSDLPQTAHLLLAAVLTATTSIVIMLASQPLVIFAIPFMVYYYYRALLFFGAAAREIRRVEATRRSPVFVATSSIFELLPSLRVYRRNVGALRYLNFLVDRLTSIRQVEPLTSRWLGTQLEGLVTMILFCVTFSAVLAHENASLQHISLLRHRHHHSVGVSNEPSGETDGGGSRTIAAFVSLAVMLVFELSETMTWIVRFASATESQMASVERILEFVCDIPRDGYKDFYVTETDLLAAAANSPTNRVESKKKKKWDLCNATLEEQNERCKKQCAEVALEFDKVWVQYRPKQPPALRNISFTLPKRCVVGVCGRTGSGKSTLLDAVQRHVFVAQGMIKLFGQNINGMSLPELRRQLTVIPQDPKLFRGSVAFNLGLEEEMAPHHKSASSTAQALLEERRRQIVWAALETVGMAQVVRGLPKQLDSHVGPNAFSVGQRQLLCFARAIAQEQLDSVEGEGKAISKKTTSKNRVVLFDEITANVDLELETRVQETFRKVFTAGNHTVLIVAHKLHSVMDADYLLVMETGGSAAEFGTPKELINDHNSALWRLVSSLPATERQALQQMAEGRR